MKDYTINIIQGGRGSGKTYTIMTEINELIVQQRRPEIIVVFPHHHYVYWWLGEWRRRFGSTPPPDYVTVSNRLKLRGRQLAKVYVEDINEIPDGIHNEIFDELRLNLRSPLGDNEIVCTSGWILSNLKTHSKVTSAADITRDRIRRVKTERELQDRFGFAAMMAKMIVDTDDKDLIDAVLTGAITPGEAVELAYAQKEQGQNRRP